MPPWLIKVQVPPLHIFKCIYFVVALHKNVLAAIYMVEGVQDGKPEKMTYKKIGNLKYAEVNKIQGRYEKKIRGLPPEYIREKVIEYGKKNGW